MKQPAVINLKYTITLDDIKIKTHIRGADQHGRRRASSRPIRRRRHAIPVTVKVLLELRSPRAHTHALLRRSLSSMHDAEVIVGCLRSLADFCVASCALSLSPRHFTILLFRFIRPDEGLLLSNEITLMSRNHFRRRRRRPRRRRPRRRRSLTCAATSFGARHRHTRTHTLSDSHFLISQRSRKRMLKGINLIVPCVRAVKWRVKRNALNSHRMR